jgi:hypothetical protein
MVKQKLRGQTNFSRRRDEFDSKQCTVLRVKTAKAMETLGHIQPA